MLGITRGALVPRRGAPPDLPLSPVGATNPSAPTGAHPPWPYLCGALPAHCCLQVESLRILLLAEQALREGLEEALARRSALDLVLSCPGSVPFMQTALGSPRLRLCPFCPASSSGTCPARGARRQAGSRLPSPPQGIVSVLLSPRCPSPSRGQVTAPCTPLQGSQGLGGAGGHGPGFYTAPNARLHPQRCTTTLNSMQELRYPPRSSDPPAGHRVPPRSSGTPQPLEKTSSRSTARTPPARSSPISPPGAAAGPFPVGSPCHHGQTGLRSQPWGQGVTQDPPQHIPGWSRRG